MNIDSILTNTPYCKSIYIAVGILCCRQPFLFQFFGMSRISAANVLGAFLNNATKITRKHIFGSGTLHYKTVKLSVQMFPPQLFLLRNYRKYCESGDKKIKDVKN